MLKAVATGASEPAMLGNATPANHQRLQETLIESEMLTMIRKTLVYDLPELESPLRRFRHRKQV